MAKRGSTLSGDHFEPTAEQRGMVRFLAATNTPIEIIASLVLNPDTRQGISKNTLKKYFHAELTNGKEHTKAVVIGKLMKLIGKDHPAAIFFYLKTQAGWREKDGGGGTSADPAELAARMREAAAAMEKKNGPAH